MKPKLNELTVEITQKCPNRCLFCSSLSNIYASKYLKREEIFYVAKQAKALGLNCISISGGEPLFHKDISSILQDIDELGLKKRLYTTGICPNGNRGTKSFVEWKRIINNGLTIIFNIQSTIDDIHDRLTRNRGSLQLTKTSLISAKKSNLSVEVHLIPNKINLETIETTVRELAAWGVDQISFLRLVPQGFARENKYDLLLQNEEKIDLAYIFRKIKSENNNIKFRYGIPFSFLMNGPKYCNAGENKLIVRYDGKVLPCEAFKDDTFNNYVLGDIRNNSLLEILNSGSSLKMLSQLKNRVNYSESCPAQFLYC